MPSSALALLRVDPARWPLSDERVRRALSLALDRDVLALSDGGDVRPARSLLLDPQAPSAVPANPATARALLRAAGAEGTLRFTLWVEPGTQERLGRAIASQLAAIGVKVDHARRDRGGAARRCARLDRVAVGGVRRSRRDLHAARGRAPA